MEADCGRFGQNRRRRGGGGSDRRRDEFETKRKSRPSSLASSHLPPLALSNSFLPHSTRLRPILSSALQRQRQLRLRTRSTRRCSTRQTRRERASTTCYVGNRVYDIYGQRIGEIIIRFSGTTECNSSTFIIGRSVSGCEESWSKRRGRCLGKDIADEGEFNFLRIGGFDNS